MVKNLIKINSLLILTSFLACTQIDPQFSQIGSSILSSTGFVSGSQVDSAFLAGSKLAKSAETLDDEQEYYLGRSVSAMILSRYKPLRNKDAVDYVNKIGLILASHSEKPTTFNGYRFMILDTDEINAVSAPGGYVFLTSGFVKILPDEDALASVLAHEIAHIIKGHGMSAISKSNLTGALLIIGKEAAASQAGGYAGELTNIFGDSVNQVFETLVTNGFSRSQEYDADTYAAELLLKAGYNSNSLRVALENLENTGAADKSGGWSSTHPKPSNRLSRLKDRTSKDASASLSTQASNMQEIRAKRFQNAMQKLL